MRLHWWAGCVYYLSHSTRKPTKWPVKTQIRQGIRPVWSESSPSAWRNIRFLASHWAHSVCPGWSESSLGAHANLLVLLCGGSFKMLLIWGKVLINFCFLLILGMNLQHHTMSPFNNPTHQGYFPMQPVYPSPHGSVQGSVYSGYTRDSGFTHNHFVGGHTSSVYSSQAPSYHGHRSHTPTSSKSGKSHHSNNSVKYSHSNDKVMMPVNL